MMIKKTMFFVMLLAISFSSCDKSPIYSESTIETFYVRNGGSDMPAFVRGNTASKVFLISLAGGPGQGALVAEGYQFSSGLEEEYAMVYWDQRHMGNAHGHYNKEDVNMINAVKDINALVKTIKQRYGSDSSIFLMGASWGGILALSYVLEDDYQNELNGWISVVGPITFTADHFQDLNNWVIELAQEEIAKGKNVEDWTEILTFYSQLDTEDNLSSNDRSKKREYYNLIRNELIIEYINTGATNTGSVFLANDHYSTIQNFKNLPYQFRDEVEALDYNNSDQMGTITSPALLIYGKYDYIVPPAHGQRIYDQISSQYKDYFIYEKSSHGPMFAEPDRFVSDVSTFIETHK